MLQKWIFQRRLKIPAPHQAKLRLTNRRKKLPVEEFFSVGDLKKIEDAIFTAELGTSGELRVHLEDTCNDDVLDHAAFIFSELEMQKTELRNGVLIYVAVDSQKFAIIGDVGIHQKTGPHFWNETRNAMNTHFEKSDFFAGLCEGVKRAGAQLQLFFPVSATDINELSNEVTIGRIRVSPKKKRRHF
ncbi:MAG: TPM domain-containing protein [Crocinitomicaceae bacterium]|nr:TPM domain-containing protein [Crocinitomicaceae bacterium]